MYNEVSVFVENKPGKLAQVAELLGNAGINILSSEIFDGGRTGVIKILTTDPEKTREVLAQANVTVEFTQAVCVEIPDVPGGLVKLAKALEEADLNVTDAYGCVLERGKRAAFIIKGDNLEAIESAARAAGLDILDSLA